MQQVSSAVTGAATLGAATVQPLVEWGLTGFKGPMPAMLPGAITAVVLTVIHYIVNRFTKPVQTGATS